MNKGVQKIAPSLDHPVYASIYCFYSRLKTRTFWLFFLTMPKKWLLLLRFV